jgi:hypothetical protein
MVCVGTPEFTTAMAHMLYCFLYCLYDAANTFQLGWVGGGHGCLFYYLFGLDSAHCKSLLRVSIVSSLHCNFWPFVGFSSLFQSCLFFLGGGI